MKKALIVYGGWKGHEPEPVAKVMQEILTGEGFDVEMADTLEAFEDVDKLLGLDLIVPHWTMGKIEGPQVNGISKAVEAGVGIAGIHGGMGDAFRENTQFQFIVGGQFVNHPGGQIDYRVHIVDHADPITADIGHFDYHSEQYYMHVDPSNHVLATTAVEVNGCTMPVVWKRMYGKGRVFYSALGHVAAEFAVPQMKTILTRGMLWAADGKAAAGA